jgi:gas vesicle protein
MWKEQRLPALAEAFMSDVSVQVPEDAVEERTNRLAWFLTGLAIGVTAAVLYAPRRGKDTRQYITGKAQQSREAVTEKAEDIVDAGREMFERGRKLVQDAADLFERGRKLVRG